MPSAPIDPEEAGGPLDEPGVERRAPVAPPLEAGRGPSLATAPELFDLAARMLDPEFMLQVFRRELPASCDEPVRVLGCKVKPAKTASSRKAIRDGRSECVYRLEIGCGNGVTREVVLLGLAPISADFPGSALEERCRELGAHPAAAPFGRLALRLESIPIGLLFFPLDPALAALAEVASPAAAELLAPHLCECRAGARIESCAYELCHYKPKERAVLRVSLAFAAPNGAPAARSVYVKLFADEHGAASHRELAALWEAARRSRWLRVPEPLGYDAGRRMLVLAEVPGGRALADWIHCLEHDLPLPRGVDQARLESCVLAAARALTELQASGVRPAKTRTYRDVLASLGKDRELLAGRAHGAPPELVTRALALVARLESAAPTDEPLVPSHGGARHKQTVGDEHGLTFVDWDGFCLANPALDAATFLARLRLEPITNPGHGGALEQLAERFRSEFLRHSRAAARHLELYEGLVLSEQMLRSFRRSARGAVAGAVAERLMDAAEERLARLARDS